MNMQKYMHREETVEHDILLHGTIKSINAATLELSEINTVVSTQGEIISKIQKKINETELTLKRASRKLSVLLRKSKNRKLFSLCLLVITTGSAIGLCLYTYKYK